MEHYEMYSKMDKLSDIPNAHWNSMAINEPAVNDRVKQIVYKASTLQGENKIAWLLRAITCIDLTTLSGDDTKTNVEALCEKALHPAELTFKWPEPLHTAAVCVYPAKAPAMVNALSYSGDHLFNHDDNVKAATVAAGFPTGQYPMSTRLTEIEYAVSLGVHEIDVVIDRSLALSHKWDELFNELKAMRNACGDSCMKTILAVGELPSLADVYTACMIAMYAGSDFIKTSTGKEAVNATLPAGVVMCRAIRDFYWQTKRKIGFKPAGGIKSSDEALQWLVLVKEELGNYWLNKYLFRIGASSLLDNIIKTIKW